MIMALLFLMVFGTPSPTPDLSSCRKLLDHAVEDKKTALKFYGQLKSAKKEGDPVLLGFRAMSEFLMCKHLINPFSRLAHFNKGKELLETAIQENNTHPELLFFRLSTQSNLPAVLKYNGNIEADKKALIAFLVNYNGKVQPDPVLYQRIKTYLLLNKYCSSAEKARIKTL